MSARELDVVGAYINPQDLLPDEVEYELKLRCVSILGSIQERRQRLRQVQLEEIRKPKVLFSKKSIVEEYQTVKTKILDLKHVLEIFPEPKLISRLRHCRGRILRASTVTREQLRVKTDLLGEIEGLLDRYGVPEDRHRSSHGTEDQDHQDTLDNIIDDQPQPNESRQLHTPLTPHSTHGSPQGLEENLLDLAAGGIEEEQNGDNRRGRNSANRDPIEYHLPPLPNPFSPYQQTPLLNRRNRNQNWNENDKLNQNSAQLNNGNWRQEVSQMIEQSLATHMEALTTNLTTMLQNQLQQVLPRTPFLPSQPVIPPVDHRPRREGSVERNYPNSVASQTANLDDFRHNHPREIPQEDYNDRRARWLRVPVNKWRVNFSGDSRGPTVTQFLNRIEILAKNNAVSEHELLCQANFFFKEGSEAEEWYYTFCHKFSTWTAFKHHLRLRFEQPNKDRVIERQMLDRRQVPTETFNAFLGSIEKLAQQLSKPMSESRKLDILMENMRDAYKPFLTIYRIDRIEDLVSVCYSLDKSMYKPFPNKARPYNQVNNVEGIEQDDEDYDDEDLEVNAVAKQQMWRRTGGTPNQVNRQPQEKNQTNTGARQKVPQDDENNVLCWNCRQFGHFWRDCEKQKKVFCHYCGQTNVITANCPNSHVFPSKVQKNESEERA